MSRNFIDADENAVERNLRFVRNDMEDNMNQFFGGRESSRQQAPPRDYKVVTPTPGFCIKSFKVNSAEKYFINVCQTAEIPAPEDITEEQLTDILQSEVPSSFRIPMSISEPRTTRDKSNNPVDACDIAVNPRFFAKLEKSILFKDFFLALVAEALSDKYNVQLGMDKSVILQHRKFMGNLVSHRVRNNDVQNVLSSYKNPSEHDKQKLQQLAAAKGPLVQELNDTEIELLKEMSVHNSKTEAAKQEDASVAAANVSEIKKAISMAASRLPEYKLRAKLKDEQVEEIIAEFYLPKCITSQEINLDVGEDRILLESMKHGYLFDKFVNYRLNQSRSRAIFDKTNKMLQVRIPVHPVQ